MQDPSKYTICMHLADVCVAIAKAPLAAEIIAESKLCLLDFLASTLAAPVTPAVEEMAALFGTGRAVLLHKSKPTSIAGATFTHGFLSTVEDLDDSHALASGMHLSATVLPAVLAIAQANGATQAKVIRAIVAGYEVAGRLARSLDQGLRARGFHATGAIGPFATCAAAGILLDLNRKQMAYAFGMAASGAGGLFAFLPTGADSRHLHAGYAGVSGLVAGTAARNGATGPLTAFEGPDGFIGPYSETCNLEFIAKPLPSKCEDYEVFNAYHKRYSACGHAIPGITLALKLREQISVSISEIEKVEIYGYTASAKLINFPVASVSEAKFSLPIVFALAYLYGDISPSEMNMTVIERPEVQALAHKIQVLEASEHTAALPEVRSGSIQVTLAGGDRMITLSTNTPIGMAGNRLSFVDVVEKFDTLAKPVLGDIRSAKLVDAIAVMFDTQDQFGLI